MDIIDFWNLAQYIEDFWFFMSSRPCVSFVASITLGAWGGLAVLQLFLRKHLMVCSESTECQNTINYSLNHLHSEVLWPWSVGNNNLVSCVTIATFSVLKIYLPFTNHEPNFWLNMIIFCILVQCCPLYTASCLPGTTFPSFRNWRNVIIMGQICNLLASEVIYWHFNLS